MESAIKENFKKVKKLLNIADKVEDTVSDIIDIIGEVEEEEDTITGEKKKEKVIERAKEKNIAPKEIGQIVDTAIDLINIIK